MQNQGWYNNYVIGTELCWYVYVYTINVHYIDYYTIYQYKATYIFIYDFAFSLKTQKNR